MDRQDQVAGRPLIGVTTSELRNARTLSPIPEGEPPQHEMALGLTYLKAIEAAGGAPVVIPPMETGLVDGLLDHFAGICLSGGPDIHPEHYGHEPHEELGPTAPDLDDFELTVARTADSKRMPVLAICRGMQTLNVSRGGTLVQHIPAIWTEIAHRQDLPGYTPTHRVELDPESRIAEIVGAPVIETNTFHHQAVDELGEGLVATGTAPDGVTEALEDPDRPFTIGVQWHVELMTGLPDHFEIFTRFVAASQEFSGRREMETGRSR